MNRVTYIVVFFILFLIINTVHYSIVKTDTNKKIDIELSNHISNLEVNYESFLHHTSKIADTLHQSVVSNQRIIEIISQASQSEISNKDKNKLRDELYILTKASFERFKTNGVFLFNFALPNNEAFLRVHKPGKYGDDYGVVREDIKVVNATQKPLRGLVPGKIAHGFRNAYPLFDKNGVHIGVVEISFSSEYLQSLLNNINKIHLHFLVNKNIFDSKMWTMKEWMVRYKPSIENEDYMFSYFDRDLQKEVDFIKNVKDQIKEKMSQNNKFALYVKDIEGDIELISFLPIKDIHNKKTMAWMVAYEKSKYIEEVANASNSLIILFIVIYALLLYLIYYLMAKKEILTQEVEKKTKILKSTNQKLLESEQELKSLNKNLHQQVEEAVDELRKKDNLLMEQSKLAQMGEMLNMIAHQWRQPLNALSASAINLSLQNDMGLLEKEAVKEASSFIQEQTQKMSTVINDFMEYNKPEANKEFYLNEAIEKTSDMVLSQLKNRSIELQIDVDKELKVFHNLKAVEHVLLNMIANARDAFEEKKDIKDKFIKISTAVNDKNIELKIEDNAGGIPENVLDKVFNPYFTTKEQGKGTGIGLYMSKQMIENINGTKISVKNNDLGASFSIYFSIPLAEA